MKEYLMQQFPFWEQLLDSQKEKLCANAQIKTFKKGEHVHHGEHDCTGVILLRKGQLRSYLLSEEGKEVTLYRLFPDEVCVLSASCMLDAITFDVSIDAQEDSEIILISTAVFQEIANQNMYVKCFGYEMSNMRFSDVMWAMQQILFMKMDKRLAIFLWDERQKQNQDDLKLTHEQIAMYTGSAREVVSRLLKYFVEEEIVSQTRGTITILDAKKLYDLTK